MINRVDYLLTTVVTYQQVALAEWLRRVPAKYMGFPRESSNLSGDVSFLFSPQNMFKKMHCAGEIYFAISFFFEYSI